jgi:hypothetical protein
MWRASSAVVSPASWESILLVLIYAPPARDFSGHRESMSEFAPRKGVYGCAH